MLTGLLRIMHFRELQSLSKGKCAGEFFDPITRGNPSVY